MSYFPDNTEDPPTHYIQHESANPFGLEVNGFTIIFWFRIDDVSNWKSLFALTDGGYPLIRVLAHDSAGLFIYAIPGSGGGTSGTDIPRETWCRCMVRATGAGTINLDWGEGVDGTLINHVVTGADMDEYTNLKIGQCIFNPPDYNDPMQGDIIGWRMWKRTLTETECEQELKSIRKAFNTQDLFISLPLIQNINLPDQSGTNKFINRPDYVPNEPEDLFQTSDFPTGVTVGPHG